MASTGPFRLAMFPSPHAGIPTRKISKHPLLKRINISVIHSRGLLREQASTDLQAETAID
jgi:hypothetical protein